MAGETYFKVELNQGLSIKIYRPRGETRVLLGVDLPKGGAKDFDKNRLALLMLDGAVELDFAQLKSLFDMMWNLDKTVVNFTSEKREVMATAWHGDISQGSGLLGKLLKADSMMVRVYYADYTLNEVSVTPEQLSELKQKISLNIFGV